MHMTRDRTALSPRTRHGGTRSPRRTSTVSGTARRTSASCSSKSAPRSTAVAPAGASSRCRRSSSAITDRASKSRACSSIGAGVARAARATSPTASAVSTIRRRLRVSGRTMPDRCAAVDGTAEVVVYVALGAGSDCAPMVRSTSLAPCRSSSTASMPASVSGNPTGTAARAGSHAMNGTPSGVMAVRTARATSHAFTTSAPHTTATGVRSASTARISPGVRTSRTAMWLAASAAVSAARRAGSSAWITTTRDAAPVCVPGRYTPST